MTYPLQAYPLGYEGPDVGYYAHGTGPELYDSAPPIDEQFVDAELEYLWKHQSGYDFRQCLDEALGNEGTAKLAEALRHGTAQEVRREIEAIFTRYWDAQVRKPDYKR